MGKSESTKSIDKMDVVTVVQSGKQVGLSDGRSGEPIPGKIGRFEILELLGSGAFGSVYRAHDPRLEREVALKVPRRGSQETQEDVRQLLHEARAAGTIQHPNICPVYEVSQEGLQYIVMAYIPGKSLEAYLSGRKEPLPPKQAALIVRRLALALEAAHAKGVIHRDLKPSNVLIDRDRKDVVLADFGVARRIIAEGGQLSVQGKVVGTPAYMSPEQVKGDSRAIGPASDVYGLGIILYRLLTGRCPFTGTVPEILGKILHVRPRRPSKIRPDVDKKLEAICLKAIAKDQGDRYTSMRRLADDLGDYLKESAGGVSNTARETSDRLTSDKARIAEVIENLSKERRAALFGYRTPPWWVWLGTSGLTAVLVILGLLFFGRAQTVAVQIVIQENLHDLSLSFFLDNHPISADKLGVPIQLSVGDHELVVKQGEAVVRRYLFRIGRDTGPTIQPEPAASPKRVAPSPENPRVRLLVPAYFYPGGDDMRYWEQLFAAARGADVVAIVNPASGPGKSLDDNYLAVIDRAKREGVLTIGYVSTGFAKRPRAQVERDVDRWFELYPNIQGIFFDEQSAGAEKVDYYVAASQYVRNMRSKALIVSNPGVVCAKEYVALSAADVICIGEHGDGIALSLPAWVNENSPDRFAFLAYDVKRREKMETLVQNALKNRVGYIFVTDAGMPNPWNRLPTWWDDEVAAVRRVNQR